MGFAWLVLCVYCFVGLVHGFLDMHLAVGHMATVNDGVDEEANLLAAAQLDGRHS